MDRNLQSSSLVQESRPALNKHQQRTEATRRKLLKAGRRIFARDGFEGARIEDIAAEAGYTRGAFYANFNAKEDLFFALLEEQMREHLGRIRRILDFCQTPQERLRAMREYYVKRIADRQWVMLILEFKLFAVRHARLRPKLLEIHRRIRSAICVNQMNGLLSGCIDSKPEAHEVCRAALEATLNGLVLERAYDPKRMSEAQAVDILGRVFDLLMPKTVAAPEPDRNLHREQSRQAPETGKLEVR
jgi:AcrR family transcriptional regulator